MAAGVGRFDQVAVRNVLDFARDLGNTIFVDNGANRLVVVLLTISVDGLRRARTLLFSVLPVVLHVLRELRLRHLLRGNFVCLLEIFVGLRLHLLTLDLARILGSNRQKMLVKM